MMAPLAPEPYLRDEAVLDRVLHGGEPEIHVYRYPGTAAVIGRGGKPHVELRADALAADGVPVLRRRGGGCAVVLDPGNLVVTVTLPLPGVGGVTSAFRAISRTMIDALAAAGVSGVTRRGVSDLALDDRKLGGSCIYRTKGLLHYATTLLVDPDPDLMERYLPHPPREPEYRRRRPHRAFVTSLRAQGLAADPDPLAARLATDLRRRLTDLMRALGAAPAPEPALAAAHTAASHTAKRR